MNSSYLSEVIALLIAALVLITTLAWNTLFEEWIDKQEILPNKLTGEFLYAIILTFSTATVIWFLTKYKFIFTDKTGAAETVDSGIDQ